MAQMFVMGGVPVSPEAILMLSGAKTWLLFFTGAHYLWFVPLGLLLLHGEGFVKLSYANHAVFWCVSAAICRMTMAIGPTLASDELCCCDWADG